jgi:CBS domain-containing protein
MTEPLVVEVDSSALHVAERLIHSRAGVVAVVDEGRFVGIVETGSFARWLLRSLPED